MTEVKDSPERTLTEVIDGALDKNNRFKADDNRLALTVEQRFPGMGKSLQEALKSIND